MLTTEATIYSTVMADYMLLGEGEGDKRNGWVLRIWYNPLIPWIWLVVYLWYLAGLFLPIGDFASEHQKKKIGNYKTAELGADMAKNHLCFALPRFFWRNYLLFNSYSKKKHPKLLPSALTDKDNPENKLPLLFKNKRLQS